MSRMNAISFEQIAYRLRAKRGVFPTCKLGNNTYAEWADASETIIVVRLHGHPIVKLYENGQVDFTLARYPTVTTRNRVNQFLIGRVFQSNRVQYYADSMNTVHIDDATWYTDGKVKENG